MSAYWVGWREAVSTAAPLPPCSDKVRSHRQPTRLTQKDPGRSLGCTCHSDGTSLRPSRLSSPPFTAEMPGARIDHIFGESRLIMFGRPPFSFRADLRSKYLDPSYEALGRAFDLAERLGDAAHYHALLLPWLSPPGKSEWRERLAERGRR